MLSTQSGHIKKVLRALWCAQVSMLEADRLHWQERYQESLNRSAPASPAHMLPVSRAATHGSPETKDADKAQRVVVAADEEAEPIDDLDQLIR